MEMTIMFLPSDNWCCCCCTNS